jgi:hypothetical protein
VGGRLANAETGNIERLSHVFGSMIEPALNVFCGDGNVKYCAVFG